MTSVGSEALKEKKLPKNCREGGQRRQMTVVTDCQSLLGVLSKLQQQVDTGVLVVSRASAGPVLSAGADDC